jgi:hypothetical protein
MARSRWLQDPDICNETNLIFNGRHCQDKMRAQQQQQQQQKQQEQQQQRNSNNAKASSTDTTAA